MAILILPLKASFSRRKIHQWLNMEAQMDHLWETASLIYPGIYSLNISCNILEVSVLQE